MDDVTYSVIVSVLKGEFLIPVCERTREQRSAIVRFWRNRDIYSLDVDGQSLLCDGKIVLGASHIGKVVQEGFRKTKGAGSRKMKRRLAEVYSGLSEKTVRGTLEKSRKYQLMKPKFRNKAAQHPVRAREVQTRHQIDLIDMTQWEVEYKDVKYKYVLSLLDVFSRHVWLKPLQRIS